MDIINCPTSFDVPAFVFSWGIGASLLISGYLIIGIGPYIIEWVSWWVKKCLGLPIPLSC